MATLSLWGEKARQADSLRFLCALFLPPEKRESLFTLLAFQAELERILRVVSEPMIGLIRLQWWRETLQSNDLTSHELLPALQAFRAAHTLSLEPLIDAQEQRLREPDAPQSDAALYRLMLQCCGETNLTIADKVGAAYAQKLPITLSRAEEQSLSRTAHLVLLSRFFTTRRDSPWRGILLLWYGLFRPKTGA